MNVVDSSGWLEYFADGPSAESFAAAVEDTTELIVPSISLYEVLERVFEQRGEGDALQAVAIMQQGMVIDLDDALALNAARLSSTLKLPMADAIMLATARQYEAVLWTQDAHLAELDGVRYVTRE